jgi:hypothetical protein
LAQSLDLLTAKVAPKALACDCFGVPQKRRTNCCLELPESRVERPDVAIYSQEEVVAEGGVPSWNSPDILTADFPYLRLNDETVVTVRNLSPDTWAVGAQVHFAISRFGIGFERQYVGSQRVSLGPSANVNLSFPLNRTILAGEPRIGVYIEIEHPHDQNRINNFGSQVVAASLTSAEGRVFALDIPLRNHSSFTRYFTLRVLAADDVVAAVDPARRSFAPYEESTVLLNTEIPAGLARSAPYPAREVTVIATAEDGSIVGGVTHSIVVDT